LLFNFDLELANRKVQENKERLKWEQQLLVYAEHVNVLGANIKIMAETNSLHASKKSLRLHKDVE
jgi:hypothetical protein